LIKILFQEILPWYLAILAAGWLAFPLAARLMAFLPDRGYTLSRPLGLLFWGFLYWLLASLHLVQNDLGGVVLALLLVAVLSAAAGGRAGLRELRAWLGQQRNLLIVSEVLFALAFLGWSLVRAVAPEAAGTEKPMELAFINAILHSDSFPPHDPWLSGYAISYYYFGYVMIAMLARITGLSGSVAFNLGGASWFALTALAAFGLVANLLALRKAQRANGPAVNGSHLAGGLLAPLFMLLISNLEGFLEVLHARGLFWQQNTAGELSSSFWKWLDIQELINPPTLPFQWDPQRIGGIWWWRASRVLQDYDLTGGSREIIDEFPFFSYYLADLHPHVLSMPFVLLAVGLALNLYLRTRAGQDGPAGLAWFRRADLWLAAVVLGGLSFLNTWDFPVYLALFAAAYGLARYQQDGWTARLLVEVAGLGGAVALVGIALYLPFYAGFASQAKGLLPSLVFFTRGVHFWVMFGALLLPVTAWLLYNLWRWPLRLQWKNGLLFAAGVTGGLWLLSSLLGVALAARGEVLGIYGAAPGSSLVLESITRRLAQPGTWLTLFVLMTITWALLTVRRDLLAAVASEAQEMGLVVPDGDARPSQAGLHADRFVLLLALLGCGLALFPEFFYLFDQFGWRMNTIFKFYFQAWMIWSLAAGYGLAVLYHELRGIGVMALATGSLLLLVMSLAYPFFGLSQRLSGTDYANLSLDGAAAIERYNPDEMAAIRWLSQAPQGVLAEAVGGSYTGYARVSTFSGQPSVLGWPGHESQWRGGAKEMGSREPDLELLFRANRWEQALEILQRYQIRYVYVGGLERGKYRVNETLYNRYLEVVFQNQQVTIYEVPQTLLTEEQVTQP
jgi:YYY domain-containing protein